MRIWTEFQHGMGRLYSLLNVPLGNGAASRLSNSIDRGSSDPALADPAVTVILKAAAPRDMPADLSSRSWGVLERELFPTPAVRPPIRIRWRTARDRSNGGRLFSFTPGRLATAALVVGAAALGAWQMPSISARSLANDVSRSWSEVQNYRAAVQFVSRVPGFQMQLSGTEFYAAPDHMRLEIDAMGIPVAMVVNGDTGEVIAPAPGTNLSSFRFLSRALQLGQLIEELKGAESVRDEGSDRVLGQECQILAFRISTPEAVQADSPSDGPDTRQETSGRIWISNVLHLPVQVETYLPDGSLAVGYRFTRAFFNVPMSERLFTLHVRASAPGDLVRREMVRIELHRFGAAW